MGACRSGLGESQGVLAVELSVGILVWNTRLRPWVLAAGVVMHTMVMVTIAVGFFSPAVLVLYLAFVPPAESEHLPRAGGTGSTDRVAQRLEDAVRPVGGLPERAEVQVARSRQPG